MEDNRKKRISIIAVLGIVSLAIIAFCIYRLVDWSARSIDFNTDDVEEGEFDVELLDMYVYPDDQEYPNHNKDDTEDIVILGNVYANNYGKDHSLVNMLKENLDANIIDLSVDTSMVSCDTPYVQWGYDAASLYHMVLQLNSHDLHYLYETEWSELFSDKERYDAFLKRMGEVDLNKVDTIMIMYNLVDYYNLKGAIAISEDDVRGLRGSYEQSLTLLQKEYPHLNFIIVSPYPSVLKDDKGNLILSATTDYGLMNSSYYFENVYFVATKYCTSFIDNYSYGINESNITEYVDNMLLTDKGIDFLGLHIINFIKNKGEANY